MSQGQEPIDSDQVIEKRGEQAEIIMQKIEAVLDLNDPRQNYFHRCIDTIATYYIDGSLDKCWEALQPIDQQMDIELLEHEFTLDVED